MASLGTHQLLVYLSVAQFPLAGGLPLHLRASERGSPPRCARESATCRFADYGFLQGLLLFRPCASLRSDPLPLRLPVARFLWPSGNVTCGVRPCTTRNSPP